VRELALYLAAGAVYVAVGVAVPELLFSWIEGAAFLLIAVWLLPALLERFR
jgi:putative Ca2+/H+ antiporter (TMEM165/GDT1 family)